jgi:protein TonB
VAALPHARSPADWRSSTGRSSRWTSAAIVVALHAVLVVGLLQFESVRTAVITAAPVMVKLITPPKPEVLPKPPPPPPPPKPQIRHKPPPTPAPPIITAQPEAPPTTFTAPPPPPVPVPLPPIEAPVAPVAVAPAPAPAPPPAPVTPPRNAAYLNNPPPDYPLESRERGAEGRVVLRVFVNESGLPQEVQVRTSSGYSRLDTTAQETVRRWKFVPARRGDAAVGAWVLVPMTFNLRN